MRFYSRFWPEIQRKKPAFRQAHHVSYSYTGIETCRPPGICPLLHQLPSRLGKSFKICQQGFCLLGNAA